MYPVCLISYLLSTILYIPALRILLIGLRCEQIDNELRSSADLSEKCLSGTHLTSFCLNIPATLLFIIGTSLYKTFVFNPKLTFNENTACVRPYPEITRHIMRSVLLLFEIFGIFIDNNTLISGCVLILNIAFFVYVYKNNWMYNELRKVWEITLMALSSWIAALNFIQIYSNPEFSAAILTGFIGNGFILTLCIIYYRDDSVISAVMSKNNEWQAIQSCIFVLKLCYEVQRNENLRNMRALIYYCSYHTNRCKIPHCTLTILMEKRNLDHAMNKTIMIEGLISSTSRVLKKLVTIDQPNSVLAKIFLLGFTCGWTANHLFAWELQKKLKNHALSLFDQYTIFFHMRKLKEYEKETEKKRNKSSELEPLEILSKLKIERRLNRMIEKSTTFYNQFWDILQDKTPDYERFLSLGKNVVQCNKRIKNLWSKLCEIRGNVSLSVARLYSLYTREILMDSKTTDELFELKEKGLATLDTEIRMMQFDEVSDGVIAISAVSRTLGRISLANNAMCSMVGYTKQELKDIHFDQLIPNIYRERHNEGFKIACFKAEGSEIITKNYKDTYLLTKSGYIVPVDIHLVDGPSLLNQYSFIGKVKLVRSQFAYNSVHILANCENQIQAVTSSIFSNLKFKRCDTLFGNFNTISECA